MWPFTVITYSYLYDCSQHLLKCCVPEPVSKLKRSRFAIKQVREKYCLVEYCLTIAPPNIPPVIGYSRNLEHDVQSDTSGQFKKLLTLILSVSTHKVSCLSVSLSVCLSACLSVCLSVCLSINPSFYLSYLPLCLFACLFPVHSSPISLFAKGSRDSNGLVDRAKVIEDAQVSNTTLKSVQRDCCILHADTAAGWKIKMGSWWSKVTIHTKL